MGPVNLVEYERLAEAALDPATFGYFAGGAGDEQTVSENVGAFVGWALRPRVLVDVGGASPATTLLGGRISMPVVVAPTAFLRLAHEDAEAGVARAAAAGGTIYCMSTLATTAPEEVARAAPGGRRWFQLYCYRDRGITRSLVDQARETGFEAIVLTVDMPFSGRRERDLRTGFAVPAGIVVHSFRAAGGRRGSATLAEMVGLLDPAVTWRDLEELVGSSGLPVIVKGILGGEDARLAVASGVAAVGVSNHGGRQLDGVLASLDALPEVVEAVGGEVPVILDGGVRRGTDVVKAVALGAQAVMIGRPVVWGLAAGGEQGVADVLGLLQEEVRLALALVGCVSPEDVSRGHVCRARS